MMKIASRLKRASLDHPDDDELGSDVEMEMGSANIF
jgi:hypothetical protein